MEQCARPMDPHSNRTGSLVLLHPRGTLALLTVALLGWLFLVWLTVDMSTLYAQLTMPGTSRWDLANVLAVFVMWAIMMAAMMLPSALPMILTFVDLSGRTSDFARGHGFVLAYLLVWLAFSALATLAQWALQALDWVDPMLVSTSAWLTGALLLIAGVYQFSPLKRICLSGCRSPMAFLIGDWRPGFRGALLMGARHGLLCLGCCWALMGLLFVGGVMNLAWLAAVSVAVAIEKVLPAGDRFARLMGMVLIGLGCTKLMSDTAPSRLTLRGLLS